MTSLEYIVMVIFAAPAPFLVQAPPANRGDLPTAIVPEVKSRVAGSYRGSVEVWYEGAWRSVCADNFTDREATVVCVESNFYGQDARARPGTEVEEENGSMGSLRCRGDETSVTSCVYYGWHGDACVSRLVASLHCFGKLFDVLSSPPTTGIARNFSHLSTTPSVMSEALTTHHVTSPDQSTPSEIGKYDWRKLLDQVAETNRKQLASIFNVIKKHETTPETDDVTISEGGATESDVTSTRQMRTSPDTETYTSDIYYDVSTPDFDATNKKQNSAESHYVGLQNTTTLFDIQMDNVTQSDMNVTMETSTHAPTFAEGINVSIAEPEASYATTQGSNASFIMKIYSTKDTNVTVTSDIKTPMATSGMNASPISYKTTTGGLNTSSQFYVSSLTITKIRDVTARTPITFINFWRQNFRARRSCRRWDYRYVTNIGRCYKLHKSPHTARAAADICRYEGGRLVSLETTKELIFLGQYFSNFIRHGHIWTSGRIRGGRLVWSNGRNSRIHTHNYRWFPGYAYPYRGHTHCIGFSIRRRKHFVLFDFPCHTPHMFVCEHPSRSVEVANGLSRVSVGDD